MLGAVEVPSTFTLYAAGIVMLLAVFASTCVFWPATAAMVMG